MRLKVLTAVALGACAVGASAHAEEPLRALDWLTPQADAVRALTEAPAECLARPAGRDTAYQVEAGRILFRSPLLLGGQAARHGLTCQACHVNGHGNPDFHIDGVSGAPGTVDVTSSIFSEVRGDGEFNPVPIPSLVDAGSRTVYGHAGEERSLAHFVRSVIMDEFAGQEPGEDAFNAVIAYVEALKSDACPDMEMISISFATYEQDIERGFDALRKAVTRGEGETADALVLALQSRLGEVHERYAGAGLTASADRLADLGRGLGDLRTPIRENARALNWRMTLWYQNWSDLKPQLRDQEDLSLYNPSVLRAVLEKGDQ